MPALLKFRPFLPPLHHASPTVYRTCTI